MIVIPDKNRIPNPLVKNDTKLSNNVGGGIQTTMSISQMKSVETPESIIVAVICCLLVPFAHNNKVKLSLFFPHSNSLMTSLES